MVTQEIFPLIEDNKKGFFPKQVYEEALTRYPTVAELVSKKAEENKDKIWLTFNKRNFSYRDIHVLSGSLAAGLSELGVNSNDKVAII